MSLIALYNSSGDIAMYRFWCFGLKLPYLCPYLGSLMAYCAYDITHSPGPQKHHPWAETQHLRYSA